MNLKKALWAATLVLGLAAGSGPVFAQKKMIQVKGSDTMVNLVQILAEEFMNTNPGSALAIMGGGSGTGITAIINGTCDIATHSREWKQKEIDLAWEKGVKPRFFVVAVDGLSIIVNEKNPLEKMTMPQVGSLYKGEIKNWKVVGGSDKAVSLYGRQSNSGTYTFLQEHVLGNKNYSSDVKEMNGNAQIIESVIQDEGGIGYVGVGYLFDQNGKIRKGIKVLNISKDASSEAFSPLDKQNIDSGKYPISRPLYEATNGKPNAAVTGFLTFETGPEGQKIVEREGFFAISETHKIQNAKNLK
ncbi:phosphate ABC transporter substrate-binding protein [bacterium]|nr:MAG: phosphate ABC transporter substrate-binding protein [bacterium]